MVKIVKRTEQEKNKGLELGQYLGGVIGVMITTLPCFLFFIPWILFVGQYRVVDERGNDDDFACGIIGFTFGVIVWFSIVVISSAI